MVHQPVHQPVRQPVRQPNIPPLTEITWRVI